MLIVESGIGDPTAESYVSVADSDTYHSNRGNTTWAALTTEQKEQALRRATDYMVQVYRLRWRGSRVNGVMALDWPRNFVEMTDAQYASINGAEIIGGYLYYPSNEVPREVKNACSELALKASSDELAPDLTQGVIREKIDVLEVEYDKYSPQYTRYRAIDNILSPLFSALTGGANRGVVRV
jgi:hypothetical protein